MKIIFLGSPGAGKGTIASILSKEYNIPHISTGDIFRTLKKQDTELGKKVKALIDAGQFVDDKTTMQIVAERLKNRDCKDGYILDGFPRTMFQAENFKEKIDAVLNFVAKDEVIIDRLSGRRVCVECDAIFHIKYIPPKVKGVCDKCSGRLMQRKDEQPDVIKKRLQIYEEKTKPLIDYYKQKGLLIEINANPEVAAIAENCRKAIERFK